MRRVLIVAYYFPPLGGMASVRMSGFVQHLPAYGWQPIVVAPRNGAYHRDPLLEVDEAYVIRTASLEMSRVAKRVLRAGGDDVNPAPVGPGRGALRTIARTLAYFPDPQIGWYLPALHAARKAMRSVRFDAIFSSSQPVTSHLIARRLHMDTGIPWVAEFRDPWSELLRPASALRRRAGKLEHALVTTAGGLVMTSPSWAALHSAKWGRPVTVITNGHDLLSQHEPGPTGASTLSYLGTFYPAHQDLTTVWDAIRELRDEGLLRFDRIRFIGAENRDLRAQLAERDLESMSEFTGFVSHTDALNYLRESGATLIAGPTEAEPLARGVIAGKTFECLATDIPIILTGDPGADVAKLLRSRPGCHIVAKGDIAGARRALLDCQGHRYTRDVSDLTRQQLTGRLSELLGQVGAPDASRDSRALLSHAR